MSVLIILETSLTTWCVLIPIAIKGVQFRFLSAGKLLARNMAIFRVGGVIAPFVSIKVIDIIISPLLSTIGL